MCQANTLPDNTISGLRANRFSSTDLSRKDKKNNNSNLNGEREERYHNQSVIQRIYGPKNGEVRKHIRLVEEKSERSRTGFMGDENHEVPYDNHPYQETYNRRRRERERERERRQRRLQNEEVVVMVDEEDVDENTISTVDTTVGDGSVIEGGEDLYKPLRILFDTQALDDTRNAENAAKIDFIKTQILPK